MKNFSFKGRMIYFGLIMVVSLAFFSLQLYSYLNNPSGTGSIILLVLWAVMVLFGLAGIAYSMKNRDRHK